MYLQIKKIRQSKGDYSKGDNLTISMIGLYDDDGKRIRWVKLDDRIMDKLLDTRIYVDEK